MTPDRGAGGANQTVSYVVIVRLLADFHLELRNLFWMRQPWVDEARAA